MCGTFIFDCANTAVAHTAEVPDQAGKRVRLKIISLFANTGGSSQSAVLCVKNYQNCCWTIKIDKFGLFKQVYSQVLINWTLKEPLKSCKTTDAFKWISNWSTYKLPVYARKITGRPNGCLIWTNKHFYNVKHEATLCNSTRKVEHTERSQFAKI